MCYPLTPETWAYPVEKGQDRTNKTSHVQVRLQNPQQQNRTGTIYVYNYIPWNIFSIWHFFQSSDVLQPAWNIHFILFTHVLLIVHPYSSMFVCHELHPIRLIMDAYLLCFCLYRAYCCVCVCVSMKRILMNPQFTSHHTRSPFTIANPHTSTTLSAGIVS